MSLHPHDETASAFLQQELERWQTLFDSQPAIIRRFLLSQGATLADALLHHSTQTRFFLPDAIRLEAGNSQLAQLPAEQRDQLVGGLLERLVAGDVRAALRQRLAELESSNDPAVATAAGLLRHATAIHLVHDRLPAGRSVMYRPADAGDIPTIPTGGELELESAITAATDAIVEEQPAEAGRGDLLVPFVPAARRFYLPHWVAFDQEGQLLVSSPAEAEAFLASMQHFMAVLHAAVALAPHIIGDPAYRQKRYGMLGQLVNQGRALARFQTRAIIQTIRRRARAQDLNRGLSLSLPYFDDQALLMRLHNFEVIPSGRIMFVPGFVVRATRLEQAKVAQDTRLGPTTCRHLLDELRMVEEAFATQHDGPTAR
jgi:hypothetical protein